MDRGYSIRLARPRDLDALPSIELRAASRFEGWAVPGWLFDRPTPVDVFAAAQSSGHLWVAVCDDHPVGFAVVELRDERLWLAELDVLPEHGRRGIGAALVDAVKSWAWARGFNQVFLTTYLEVPWNAPFYLRLGFEIVGDGQLEAQLKARLEGEIRSGLASIPRVAMRAVVAG